MRPGAIEWSYMLHLRLAAWLEPPTVPPTTHPASFAARDLLLGNLFLVLFGVLTVQAMLGCEVRFEIFTSFLQNVIFFPFLACVAIDTRV
jgi:hypothetical protein